MQRVAGTDIHVARDDDRRRCILFSDLHIGDLDSAVFVNFRRLLEDTARAALESRVIILGDLFEFWIGPRQLASAAGAGVAEVLQDCSARGLSITILVGNRDFMLDQKFAQQTGVRVVAGGLSFRLGESVCLALHGDELCLNDRPYQRSKPYLRHPMTRGILRMLPLGLALRLGQKVRAKSMISTAQGDTSRFAPVEEAVAEAFAAGFDRLVFGHIHAAARGMRGSGGEYCILPAFDDSGVHLDSVGDHLQYRGLDGVKLPDAAPRSFPHRWPVKR